MLKSGFKRTINWNNYHSKKVAQARNLYFGQLIEPCFHGINDRFLSLFENNILKATRTYNKNNKT